MIIKIDNREGELINCCKYILEISPIYKNIQIVVENLPLGDIIILNDNVEKVIIERKSLRDLAASIKDGRYEEQSYRLNGLPMHNHNIIYLIEGDMNKFNIFKDRMEKLTLYSAMVSINLYKGFSLMRSLNIEETALIICNMAYKMNKAEADGKMQYYLNKATTSTTATTSLNEELSVDHNTELTDQKLDIYFENYCNVVKKVKKDNVTPENIGEIMLSQIPGISSTIAIELMKQFKSLPNLVMKIKENEDCLKNISYTNSKGQVRKINKTALLNVAKYLHIS